MIRTIETQYDILRTDRFIKSLKNLDELQRVMKNPTILTPSQAPIGARTNKDR